VPIVVSIDINGDLGESFGQWQLGDDQAKLRAVSSANIACGFHAGDPSTARAVVRTAIAGDVTIGAHVGYRDLIGFGRRFIDVDPRELADDVLYQIAALDGIARAEGGRVRYVKPHGALYNAIGTHVRQAQAVVDGISAYSPDLVVLGLPGAVVLERATARGLRVAIEAFADRAYLPSGALVPRGTPNAVLHDPDDIAARVVRLATTSRLEAVDGRMLNIEADSICVHGDTPGAVGIANRVRSALAEAGVSLVPFAGEAPARTVDVTSSDSLSHPLQEGRSQ
jgi:UPF0271 protein